jgi:hypothetical protein
LWGQRHGRFVAGTVDRTRIGWYGAPDERNEGGLNVGMIRGKRIDITEEDASLFMEYQGTRPQGG